MNFIPYEQRILCYSSLTKFHFLENGGSLSLGKKSLCKHFFMFVFALTKSTKNVKKFAISRSIKYVC